MKTASLAASKNILLATWNRPRTSEELMSFISRRQASLPSGPDLDI